MISDTIALMREQNKRSPELNLDRKITITITIDRPNEKKKFAIASGLKLKSDRATYWDDEYEFAFRQLLQNILLLSYRG